MAIDTREKRQAIIAFCRPGSAPTVTPNASPDAEWRTEVGWLYPGILPASSAAHAGALVSGPFLKSKFEALIP